MGEKANDSRGSKLGLIAVLIAVLWLIAFLSVTNKHKKADQVGGRTGREKQEQTDLQRRNCAALHSKPDSELTAADRNQITVCKQEGLW